MCRRRAPAYGPGYGRCGPRRCNRRRRRGPIALLIGAIIAAVSSRSQSRDVQNAPPPMMRSGSMPVDEVMPHDRNAGLAEKEGKNAQHYQPPFDAPPPRYSFVEPRHGGMDNSVMAH